MPSLGIFEYVQAVAKQVSFITQEEVFLFKK